MLRSWKVGSAFGIGIYVHWSLLLLLGWLVLSNLSGASLPMIVYPAVLLAAVFGCVALHELGHALMARQYGIRTRDITLYPIGGVARLERMSERPGEEFWIAVAGPAVNVVLAGLLFPCLLLLGQSFIPGELGFPVVRLMQELAWINVVLVVFNLLPVFPMDGGRVFRAFLTTFVGSLRATEVAATVGAVLALLIGTVGAFVLGNYLLPLLAAFVFLAGQQELSAVRQREYRRRAQPLTVLPAEFADIPVVEPLDEPTAFSGVVYDPEYRAWVVWRDGRRVQG
jgi:Zn-dependent protease